ncbi:MAG: polysaccharide deacetylase family protein [Actinobacteria bacterium]|nr:polysaccharide deacetylase family protein [Actinomycetota bacterium]
MILTRAAVAVASVVALGAGAVLGHVSGSAAAESVPAAAPQQIVASAIPTPKATPSPSADSYPSSTLVPDKVQKGSNGINVVSKITTKNPVFFITIDDGWGQPKSATDYVAATHLPVTSFLTNAAVQGNWSFFKKMSAYDAVQNHTMTHKALSKDSTDRQYEICGAQARYATKIGTKPWILRPPYGAGFMPRRAAAPAIEKTAASCGIKHIALWNVTVDKNRKMAFAGKSFQKGDIVLLHFEGDLAANLKALVQAYAKLGLKPASLSQYLAR